jgi:hypothetical protein
MVAAFTSRLLNTFVCLMLAALRHLSYNYSCALSCNLAPRRAFVCVHTNGLSSINSRRGSLRKLK